jgi:perosamine synthetase
MFKSEPYVNQTLVNRITKKIYKKEFSKFIGSPEPNLEKYLYKSSSQLVKIKSERSFFGGKSVLKLENAWSKICKTKYVISVNSATSALTAAIMSCNLGPGDEIICSPFTFTASVAAIISANAIPKFCDVDKDTYCLNPKLLEGLINKKTKAVMAIHWNSNAGDLDKIIKICKKYKLILIEDASQCHGMKYKKKMLGTFGDVGVFSLNEPKNIMTGEGGLIVTNNKLIAAKCRLIRNHGENVMSNNASKKELVNIVGYNFRLPEILAEIGLFQITKLNFLNKIRKKNYLFLLKSLDKHSKYIKPQKITNKTYFPYTVAFRVLENRYFKRSDLLNFFKKKINISPGFQRLMSEHPMFTKKIAYGKNHCPFSCHIYNKEFIVDSTPVSKKLNDKEYIAFYQIGYPNGISQMKLIINTFDKFFKNINL